MSYRADKQVIDTHTHTDTQTQVMTIPEGQNWPRVEKPYPAFLNPSLNTTMKCIDKNTRNRNSLHLFPTRTKGAKKCI